MRPRTALVVAAIVAGLAGPIHLDAQIANASASLTFAVLGDNGVGTKAQYELGQQMELARARTPFELVILLGDNMYGRQEPRDYIDKFQRPYAPLLKAGVTFFATLGNHDDPAQRNYRDFNMGGERYYSFARNGVRFFVLDTNLMDPKQLAWARDAFRQSSEPWKVAYFHHPLYSDGGRHGSQVELRVMLEPLLVEHGVSVVFSGHDHSYERFKPQKGITYFLAGSGGKLRRGDITPSPGTAAYFDEDQAFMVVEIAGDQMRFQTIARTGRIVDSGVIQRRTS
jgi:predicted MPP superfamily phosphohydrolase